MSPTKPSRSPQTRVSRGLRRVRVAYRLNKGGTKKLRVIKEKKKKKKKNKEIKKAGYLAQNG